MLVEEATNQDTFVSIMESNLLGKLQFFFPLFVNI